MYVPYCIVITQRPDAWEGLSDTDGKLDQPEVIGSFVTLYLAQQYAARHLDVRWIYQIVPMTSQFA